MKIFSVIFFCILFSCTNLFGMLNYYPYKEMGTIGKQVYEISHDGVCPAIGLEIGSSGGGDILKEMMSHKLSKQFKILLKSDGIWRPIEDKAFLKTLYLHIDSQGAKKSRKDAVRACYLMRGILTDIMKFGDGDLMSYSEKYEGGFDGRFLVEKGPEDNELRRWRIAVLEIIKFFASGNQKRLAANLLMFGKKEVSMKLALKSNRDNFNYVDLLVYTY